MTVIPLEALQRVSEAAVTQSGFCPTDAATSSVKQHRAGRESDTETVWSAASQLWYEYHWWYASSHEWHMEKSLKCIFLIKLITLETSNSINTTIQIKTLRQRDPAIHFFSVILLHHHAGSVHTSMTSTM